MTLATTVPTTHAGAIYRRPWALLEFVHEFRAELGVILSYRALLVEGATDNTTTSDLGTIQLATQRVLDLTNQLRALARQGIPESGRSTCGERRRQALRSKITPGERRADPGSL